MRCIVTGKLLKIDLYVNFESNLKTFPDVKQVNYFQNFNDCINPLSLIQLHAEHGRKIHGKAHNYS